MIVLVAGGRDYTNYARICEVLDDVLASSPTAHIRIVNGGARGADQLSTTWAKMRGEEWIEVPVAKNPEHQVEIKAMFNWVTHGKAAGPLRNGWMLSTHNPDYAVVFPGNDGTLDMLTKLFYAEVPTRVVGR